MLLPAFAPTAGRLRPQAENARAVFRQPHRNGLAAPAPDRLREPCAAATVFQRHLRLKSTPGGTRHLRCREAQVMHLTGRERVVYPLAADNCLTLETRYNVPVTLAYTGGIP